MEIPEDSLGRFLRVRENNPNHNYNGADYDEHLIWMNAVYEASEHWVKNCHKFITDDMDIIIEGGETEQEHNTNFPKIWHTN